MKVRYVKSKRIKGYYGMNPEAGRELKVKCPKNTILIVKSLRGKKSGKRVIVHEKVESYLMKKKGLNYKEAHRIAEKFEKRIK